MSRSSLGMLVNQPGGWFVGFPSDEADHGLIKKYMCVSVVYVDFIRVYIFVEILSTSERNLSGRGGLKNWKKSVNSQPQDPEWL